MLPTGSWASSTGTSRETATGQGLGRRLQMVDYTHTQPQKCSAPYEGNRANQLGLVLRNPLKVPAMLL